MEEPKKLLVTPEVKRFRQHLGSISPIKVAEVLDAPLHIIQEEIARFFEAPYVHSWHYMVLKLARRLGKTFVARKIMVALLLTPESKIALISHSTSLSDETFNEVLKDLMKLPDIRDKVRSFKKEGIIEIPELGTRMITSSALNFESRMVGRANTHIMLDEFFLIPPETQKSILNFLEPTLITYGRTDDGISNGKVLIMSTPRGTQTGSVAGLKDLAGIQGKKGHKSFKYTIYDNPFITEEEIEEIRQSTPKDIFEQEYLVEYTRDSKTVFRNFDKNKHIIHISKVELKDIAQNCDLIVALDMGIVDGNGASIVLYDNKRDTYYVIDEYYAKDEVSYDFIKNMKQKMEGWSKDLDIPFSSILWFYDPSALETARVAQKSFDLTLHKAKNKRTEGIDYVNKLLQGNGDEGKPKLYFLDTCKTHIDMFEYAEFKLISGVITNQFAKDPSERQSHYECCVTTVYATYTHYKTSHNSIIII